MSVFDAPFPSHKEKQLHGLKAAREIKPMTLYKTKANPSETLYVHVPKLNEGMVIVPGSLALRFDIVLYGGHVNNFLVQNVARAPVSKLTVKFAG